MDTPTLALAIKKASEIARQVSAEVAERVARSIVPERGPVGPKGDPYPPHMAEDLIRSELKKAREQEKREVREILFKSGYNGL